MSNIFVGLTDYDWYCTLKNRHFDEVNFWRPGSTGFQALQSNDLFLFKLKKPYYAIVGGGFFVKYSLVPIPIAWEAFGEKNGTASFEEFSVRLKKYREKNGIDIDYPSVGCIILAEPFFFEERDWISPPNEWRKSVVVGKRMLADSGEGKRIHEQILGRLQISNSLIDANDEPILTNPSYNISMAKHRLGQGAFRVVVTDTYNRRCAISGEKTLPVLEAAHIKPFAENGPNSIQNGILLRSDIHTLFDKGYITIAPDFHVEVSHRIKEDFGNGKIYYQHHGDKLIMLPKRDFEMPDKQFLSWHNEKVYLG
jgi:putative restriction endonuclease